MIETVVHSWRRLGWVLVVVMMLVPACGPEAPPESEPQKASEAPVAPEQSAAPLPEETSATAVSRSAPTATGTDGDGAQKPSETSASGPVRITAALVERLQRGMTPEAVDDLLGVAGVPVGGDGETVKMIRWTDSAGNSVTARFDDGALRTRSRLRTPAPARADSADAAQSEPEAPELIGGKPAAQIAPGVYVPLDRAVTSANRQPMGVRGPVADPDRAAAGRPQRGRPPAREPVAREPVASAGTEEDGPAVAIAGAKRRAREAGDRPGSGEGSYRPHAKLPAFTRTLPEGRYEVRFINPTDTAMTVGLRQDGLGRDVPVPAGGRASLFVDKGVYGVYFLCDDEPYARYEANPLTIDGFKATDVEMHLSRDDVEVRLIDYSLPN